MLSQRKQNDLICNTISNVLKAFISSRRRMKRKDLEWRSLKQTKRQLYNLFETTTKHYITMIPKLLKRFYLKPDSHQRDYIGIWRTDECNILLFLSFTNIMCKGNAYVRLGWLFWCVEYFKDGVLFAGCDEEGCQGNCQLKN